MSDKPFDKTPGTWDGAGYGTQAEVDAHNRGIRIGQERKSATDRLERYVLALAAGVYDDHIVGAVGAYGVVADAKALMAAVDAEAAK